MMDQKQIEKLLKINGLPATAPDEEIRSVLVSAKWNNDDVETALTVLRENEANNTTRVDTLHNVFATDKKLSPEQIKKLLGIDLEITTKDIVTLKRSELYVSFCQFMTIAFYATFLAFGSVLVVMYSQGIGIFHPGL